MGGGSSTFIKIHESVEESTRRIPRDEYLDSAGHTQYAFKFDALSGADGCVSRIQVNDHNIATMIETFVTPNN